MPARLVLPKFKAGKLHSGSKTGPVVKSKAQALAIMESEKKNAAHNPEYQAAGAIFDKHFRRVK